MCGELRQKGLNRRKFRALERSIELGRFLADFFLEELLGKLGQSGVTRGARELVPSGIGFHRGELEQSCLASSILPSLLRHMLSEATLVSVDSSLAPKRRLCASSVC